MNKVPRRHPNKPTLPDVTPMLADIYKIDGHYLGGHLRMMLENQWTSDEGVFNAIGHAFKEECRPCLSILSFIVRMSGTQRSKLGSLIGYQKR